MASYGNDAYNADEFEMHRTSPEAIEGRSLERDNFNRTALRVLVSTKIDSTDRYGMASEYEAIYRDLDTDCCTYDALKARFDDLNNRILVQRRDDYRDNIHGGSNKRRIASSKKPSSTPPKWVSTGRQTTLKDGSKRTVYRNSKTGERATKRMTERNGKRTAKYVKI